MTMPRFIRVQLQCDWADCETVADEGDGLVDGMSLAIDGKPAKEFLLCKPHRDTVDEMIMPLMQKGTKVEPVAKRPKSGGGAAAPSQPSPAATGGGQKRQEFDCQVDGCGRTLHNRTGMAQHVTRTHDFESLADYEETFPVSPDHHE